MSCLVQVNDFCDHYDNFSTMKYLENKYIEFNMILMNFIHVYMNLI